VLAPVCIFFYLENLFLLILSKILTPKTFIDRECIKVGNINFAKR